MSKTVISNFVVETPHASTCASCTLPGREVKLMRLPDLPGLFCSVLCAEMAIAERGCNWCGAKLEKAHGNQKFCSDGCKDKGEEARYGDGARLVAWLMKHAPGLLCQITEGGRCLHCGASLAGKRQGAKFCDGTCRNNYHRENPNCGRLSVAGPAKDAGIVKGQNRGGTIALTGGRAA